MAEYYTESYDYEVAPVYTGYWGPRVAAYIIDSIFILFPLLLITYAFVGIEFLLNPLENILILFIFMLLFGIFQVMYFAFLEGTGEKSYTIGKAIVGLEVINLDGGPVTGSQAFRRNSLKILKILLLIDIIGGVTSKRREDYSQKLTDISARTAIQILQPTQVQQRRPRFKKVSTGKKRGEDDEGKGKGYLGDFPIELLNGECPKCHSPYKIVPPEDRTTWSGLWNYRCTWCNKLVFDTRPGRVQPPKWT
jgi:uncharacterized RDD family membrane protein YckC/phage FluMu protein Com